MKWRFTLALLMLVLASAAYAEETCEETACEMPEGKEICVFFFYGTGCPHCARIEPLIDQLEKKYPETNFERREIYFNSTNQEQFLDFIKRYEIETAGVPALFIGDMALMGEQEIRKSLEDSILHFQKNGPICPETYTKAEGKPHDLSPTKKIELTLPAVLTAALVDSINPCAFAVMIFLLVYLSGMGARHRIIKVGLTYIGVIFVVYFFSGLGLLQVIQTTGLTRTVYKIAATVAIVAGLINVKDFFWYGKGISLSIPKSQEPLIRKYIQKATIPSAIILGVLVSLFELPCTGGVYLAILGLLSTKMTMAAGIPYLLLYNLIFVLPLFGILILIYRGVPAEKAEQWRLSKRKWMKLAMGLVMIALGAIMLLGWI